MNFNKLINQLKSDYPDISFIESGGTFSWRPSSNAILYDSSEPQATQLILHELGHAISSHNTYTSDIQLIRMEREAWIKALDLSKSYQIDLDEDFIEDSLDSYRDWLHKKSTCPSCGSTGFQTSNGEYTCPSCRKTWQVNDGIVCRIYRRISN